MEYTIQNLFTILIYALIYFILAWLGLKSSPGIAGPTPIWPPAGFALALLVLEGFQMWPAIALGAFASALTHIHDPMTIVGFTLADTAEPLLGAWFLDCPHRFQISFNRLNYALRFILLAAIPSTIIGAALGISTLCLAGLMPWTQAPAVWFDWWVPNLLSDFLLAPLILSWAAVGKTSWKIARLDLLEFIIEFVILTIIDFITFFLQYPHPYIPRILLYLSFVAVIALALRWGLRISILALLFTTLLAIAGTYLRHGPFDVGSLHDNLVVLQFSSVIAGTVAMVLCAILCEQEQALTEAENAVQVRDDFLSIASHELNTPLTSLKLQIQFLRTLVNKGAIQSFPREKLAQLLETSDQEIGRFSELVSDLLDVSRITSARFFPSTTEEADLSEIVRSAVNRFQHEADKTHSRFLLKLEPRLLGRWDKSRIDQVVVNLLSNALKYGPGQPIEIVTRTSEGKAEFSIRDQGIGIAVEHHEQIFGRFMRAASMQTYGGLGLGLYISKEIIQAHGGTIRVESEPGKGSTFTFEIPLSR